MSQMFQVTVHGNGVSWFNIPHSVAGNGSWHYIGNSFGVRIFETAPGVFAARFENGAVGRGAPGAFYFDRITIKCSDPVSMAPRKNHRIDGYTVTIGGGGEYMPIRAIMARRFVCAPWWRRWLANIYLAPAPWRLIYALRPRVTKHEHLALPKALETLKSKYDDFGERILTAQRTGQPDPGADMHFICGAWAPYDELDPGYVSGKNIEPFSGFEKSALWRILAHDGQMERMPVSFVDAHTGDPIHARRNEYYTSRGFNVSTQLAEFVMPLSLVSGDDRRVPREINTGACEYRHLFAPNSDGSDFYNQRFLATDDAHLCRATRHAKAAAFLYGDPVALLDLEAIAADANTGVHLFDKDTTIFGNPVARYPDHKGCDRYGRGLAWSLNAIQCVETQWAHDAEMEIVGELLRVQDTDTGSYQVCKPPPNQPQGWAPDPFVEYGFPGDLPIVHTLELSYLATGVALAGYTRSAERAAAFMSMTPPNQWIAAVPGAQPQVGVGESFSVWCLWGVLAERRPAWLDVMQRMVPPGGHAPCGADVKAALLAAQNYEASAKAIEAT